VNEESVEPPTPCFLCERETQDADRDGWHIFSDGADEQYALCCDCARARATHRVAARQVTNIN
jgi:hypothetical protein